jgi:hypothetical protein
VLDGTVDRGVHPLLAPEPPLLLEALLEPVELDPELEPEEFEPELLPELPPAGMHPVMQSPSRSQLTEGFIPAGQGPVEHSLSHMQPVPVQH